MLFDTMHRKWTACVILLIVLAFPSILPVAQEIRDNQQALEYFKEGVLHFNRKDFEASVDFFRKSLGSNPLDNRTRYFLGLAYHKAGFEENALFEFNTILQREQNNELLKNLTRFIGRKSLVLTDGKKNDDYAPGLQISGESQGKYHLTRLTGVDVDESGNIYVASFGSNMAVKFTRDGKPLLAFSSYKLQPGRVYDIAVDGDGNVFISDFTNDVVYRFREDGRYIASIGSSGVGDGQFYGPTALALDKNKDLYVIDSGNVRVEKFSRDGEFLLSFGKRGDGREDLQHPSGIAVDHAGRIYVSDHSKKSIQVYDPNGNFITDLEGGNLKDPYGISIENDGSLLVSDRDSIKLYDLMHSTWSEMDTDDRIKRVLDVKKDGLGQVYACDYEGDIVMQFVPKQDKYRNLNVIFNSVDLSEFPTVFYFVSVFDADGLPVYGLGSDNFLASIGGGTVGKVDLSYNDVRNSRLKILFLVSKSASMQANEADVNRYIGQLVAKASDNDEMAVIGFNDRSWIASSFTRSKLRTLDAIAEPRYNDRDSEGHGFDRAFRRAIDYVNKEFYKKAVVVITDSNFDERSFSTYSMESCVSYASNNSIPVYFLSFGGRHNSRMEYFARSTGGRFFDVIHSNDYPFLYETIQGYRSSEYVVFFRDVYDPALENFYLDAEVEVDYNGRIGKSSLGLVYP
jgi:sugar lactone lactonase YvrE